MGLGLTDGESIERLWSYLGGFSKITKEMTPENRVDLLTDGLLNYGRKVKENLGVYIYKYKITLYTACVCILKTLCNVISKIKLS